MKKLLVLIISVLLVPLFTSCSFNTYRYDDYEKYVSASEKTFSEEIKEIEVNWINGNVNIVQDNDGVVSIREENYSNYPLFYYLDGTTLKIEFVENGTNNFVFNTLNKDLYIDLPASTTVDIDATLINGNLTATGEIYTNEFNADLVNGNIDINSISGNHIFVKSVNGNIDLKSINVNSLDVEKVNGNLNINSIEKAVNIDIDSVNGADTIYVKESLGYEVKINSIGYYSSEYDNAYFYGNKLVNIDYDSVNGTLSIKK